MPVFNTPPPPIPLQGRIQRMMTPNFIADYEGLSTASWSTGVTGNIGSAPSSSWNCRYHHVVRPDPRIEYNVILPPVRWEIAAPSSGLGTYDFWDSRPGTQQGYIPQGLSDGGGTIGLINKLLPSGHFADYAGGFVELLLNPDLMTCQKSGNAWLETTLQAISSGTQISTTGPVITPAAIRHRINGTAVGSLVLDPPNNRAVTSSWRANLAEGDSYSIDIWYRFRIPAQNTSTATKACAYIPTSLLSNGSRRVLGNRIPWMPLAVFQNVNFSPSFNYTTHTYSVTIAGHSGYTLKDGSNGPHPMVTGGAWKAFIYNGVIHWRYLPQNGYCNAIVFRWNREIPHVEFYPGPLNSTWGGVQLGTPVFIYRAAATSGYLSGTNSTDFGPLTHIDAGTYTQAGTTTFNLQPIQDGYPQYDSSIDYYRAVFPEAFSLVGIFAAPHIPTSITLTRVSQ